jgi:protein O-GlcNAc transferase
MLEYALHLHQNGRFSEAGQLYQQILTTNPRHPDCLHLPGMIAYQEGRFEIAADTPASADAQGRGTRKIFRAAMA